jgi:hypothetical protein
LVGRQSTSPRNNDELCIDSLRIFTLSPPLLCVPILLDFYPLVFVERVELVYPYSSKPGSSGVDERMGFGFAGLFGRFGVWGSELDFLGRVDRFEAFT